MEQRAGGVGASRMKICQVSFVRSDTLGSHSIPSPRFCNNTAQEPMILHRVPLQKVKAALWY